MEVERRALYVCMDGRMEASVISCQRDPDCRVSQPVLAGSSGTTAQMLL